MFCVKSGVKIDCEASVLSFEFVVDTDASGFDSFPSPQTNK